MRRGQGRYVVKYTATDSYLDRRGNEVDAGNAEVFTRRKAFEMSARYGGAVMRLRRRRTATIEAAARKLLEALPRCQAGQLFLSPMEGTECSNMATRHAFDYRHGRDVCDECATKIEAIGEQPVKPTLCDEPLSWADAARELEKALGGET